jgi:hypothetical protein
VSQVTRSQGHQTKGWILDGQKKYRFGSKNPKLKENSRGIGKIRKVLCLSPCPFLQRRNPTRRGMKEDRA